MYRQIQQHTVIDLYVKNATFSVKHGTVLLKAVDGQSNNIDVIDLPEGRVRLPKQNGGSGLYGDVD